MSSLYLDFKQMVTNDKGQVVATSLKVAQYFNRPHKSVLRAIERLDCSKEFMTAHFCAHIKTVAMPRGGQRKSVFYTMTQQGFVFLVMGFTGKLSAQIKEAYINAFDAMANELNGLLHHYNQTAKALDQATKTASEAGRNLRIVGKYHKPFLKRRLSELEQLILPCMFDGVANDASY